MNLASDTIEALIIEQFKDGVCREPAIIGGYVTAGQFYFLLKVVARDKFDMLGQDRMITSLKGNICSYHFLTAPQMRIGVAIHAFAIGAGERHHIEHRITRLNAQDVYGIGTP